MTPADAPYRSPNSEPQFVCVVCFKCSALGEEDCAECGNRMRAVRDGEVASLVVARANARIKASAKRQIIFGASFAIPCFLLLWWYDAHHPLPLVNSPSDRTDIAYFFGKNARQSITIVPLVVLLLLTFLHPYIFRDRVGRKYRASVSSVEKALDVLGTRKQ